jgi:hypothetical protein
MRQPSYFTNAGRETTDPLKNIFIIFEGRDQIFSSNLQGEKITTFSTYFAALIPIVSAHSQESIWGTFYGL